MTTVEYFSTDNSGLERYGDRVKAVVLEALARDGTLEQEVAEEWSMTHTVVRRKKSFFRTSTDRFRKTEEADGVYLLVVKLS